MLKNNAQKDVLESIHREFVEEIIEKSEKIPVEEINPESFRTAFRHLDWGGFPYKETVIVTYKSEYQEVHDIPVYEYDIIPEGTAIVMHPDSVAPAPPEMVKPGVIAYPDGIVTLQEE